MSKKSMTFYDDVLDERTLHLLSEAPSALDLPRQRMQRLRERVMGRIDEDAAGSEQTFVTIRDRGGVWVDIAPKIKRKLLFSDPENGTECYLLKAEPGATAPPHEHAYDEHCLILEGEVEYEDGDLLKAGDYQFAPAGTTHGTARTEVGVLAYLQTTLPGAPAPG